MDNERQEPTPPPIVFRGKKDPKIQTAKYLLKRAAQYLDKSVAPENFEQRRLWEKIQEFIADER